MSKRHVLWTGGWDSSYRVLELALIKGDHVQPHYVVDPDRTSTPYELAAMDAIRSAAVKRGGKIAPLRIESLNNVPVSEEAQEKYDQLAFRFGIGPQYLWLSEYARQSEIEELELSIHSDDWPAYSVYRLLKSVQNDTYVSGSMSPEGYSAGLFRHFSFPLMSMTKMRMRTLACDYRFYDLMEMTWFCHQPTRSGRPCGFCNPCRWTLHDGLGYRLPWSAKVLGWIGYHIVPGIPSFRARRGMRYLLRAMR